MPARRVAVDQVALSTLNLIAASPVGDAAEFDAAYKKLAELEGTSVAHLRLIGTSKHFHYFQEWGNPFLFEVPVSPSWTPTETNHERK